MIARHDANSSGPFSYATVGPNDESDFRSSYLSLKAVLDFVAAVVLALVIWPLVLLAMILVKLTSPGPVIYTQIRLGRGGRPFKIYKIRTMRHDCEATTGPRWSSLSDPRTTAIGRFLRRSHLDELPQLWNILRGEMSLVGPRPERPEFVSRLEIEIPRYRERLAVRPGVTGLAQVQLPPDTDLESVRRKIICDLAYIEKLRFGLDLRILLCTALGLVAIPYSTSRKLLRVPTLVEPDEVPQSDPAVLSLGAGLVENTHMAYALFILVNATLFIRPAEIVPALEGLPIYNVLISASLAISFSKIAERLKSESLAENPINVCMLGLLASIILSSVVHLNFFMAKSGGIDFLKIVLYYFLLVTVIDTPARLIRFLWFLVAFTAVLTTLALLHYHEVISIPSLEAVADQEVDASGEKYSVMRLCSTGIYNDPNDLCLILLVAMGICAFGLSNPRFGMLRPLWIFPLLLFGYALTKTYSRGGFLAMLMAMMVLFHARFGLRKAVLMAAMALPVMFVVFGGRQTNISTQEDTGQDRIQLWSQGMKLFRQEPLFGIGQHRYVEEVGLVAHNSYIHSFTELGFLGGSLFVGLFYYAIATLHRLGAHEEVILDPELKLLRPYLLAIIAAYGAGLLAISRNYIVPTYMIFGIVTVYLQLATKDTPVMPRRLGSNLIGHFVALGTIFVVIAYIFTRMFARFGA